MRVERLFGIEQADETTWRFLEPNNFPFFDLEFLRALESSGSIGSGTGWSPVYLLAREHGGLALGALCLYLKSDSYGEYVFDWEWARAYREHGLRYYPKLVSAVPFTPATGPKLLLRPDVSENPVARAAVRRALLGAARELGEEYGVSSSHALFLPKRELEDFTRQGFAVRHSLQFHWRNRGYGSFSDYLEALVGKRRRQISRERRQLAGEGLTIERLTGKAILPEHAASIYRLYLRTFDRKWGFPYLTEGFFHEILRTMRDRVLLVFARKEGARCPIAGALFFYKGWALFGRNWGAAKEIRNLHFELCYYQGIEFSVERGLKLFEAGAQGEHKLARGFLPSLTYSAHDIRHPVFRRAIEQYIEEEKELLSVRLSAYADHNPYKLY